MQSLGVEVWIDEAEIRVGDSLIERIEEGIRKTEYFAVLLSTESVKSAWVKRELRMAMTHEIDAQKVKVLPILIEDCELPGFLRDKYYADFRPPDLYEESFIKIVQMLGVEEQRVVSMFQFRRITNIGQVLVTVPPPPTETAGTMMVACYMPDIVILDRELLTSLAVLFDEIWLFPNGYNLLASGISKVPTGALSLPQELYAWFREYRLLFSEGILRLIDAPTIDVNTAQLNSIEDAARENLQNADSDASTAGFRMMKDVLLGIHHRYAARVGTELFIAPSKKDEPSVHALPLASLFDIRFPMLNKKTAEQILEIRDSVEVSRENLSRLIAVLSGRELSISGSDEPVGTQPPGKIVLPPSHDDFLHQINRDCPDAVNKDGTVLEISCTPWDSQVYKTFASPARDLFAQASSEEVSVLTGTAHPLQFVGRRSSNG
jgi:hypothetical protein